jgi:putative phosphotransacetylase
MADMDIKRLVTLSVLKECAGKSRYFIPAAVSNRHIHLSQDALDILFGKGYELKPSKPLSQPGQYACEEKLTLVGSKGKIEGIRILGPVRPETQVEISVTDSFLLGIKPVVRMSGDLKDTPGGKLIGPKG